MPTATGPAPSAAQVRLGAALRLGAGGALLRCALLRRCCGSQDAVPVNLAAASYGRVHPSGRTHAKGGALTSAVLTSVALTSVAFAAVLSAVEEAIEGLMAEEEALLGSDAEMLGASDSFDSAEHDDDGGCLPAGAVCIFRCLPVSEEMCC